VQKLHAFVHSFYLTLATSLRVGKAGVEQTHGLPKGHLPLMIEAIDEFAAWTLEFTM
jgi:hypothetical protein